MSPQSVFQQFRQELERYVASTQINLINIQNVIDEPVDKSSFTQTLVQTAERFYRCHQSLGKYLKHTKEQIKPADFSKLVAVHHDLRAPASAAKGYAQLVQQIAEESEPDLPSFIGHAKRQSDRMAEISNDLNRPFADLYTEDQSFKKGS